MIPFGSWYTSYPDLENTSYTYTDIINWVKKGFPVGFPWDSNNRHNASWIFKTCRNDSSSYFHNRLHGRSILNWTRAFFWSDVTLAAGAEPHWPMWVRPHPWQKQKTMVTIKFWPYLHPLSPVLCTHSPASKPNKQHTTIAGAQLYLTFLELVESRCLFLVCFASHRSLSHVSPPIFNSQLIGESKDWPPANQRARSDADAGCRTEATRPASGALGHLTACWSIRG